MLGNLQSDGHGIDGLETMLSIGLGQDQQFTLILQTLAQLTSVYGDSVDKIVQGNTSNIVFLKSTDDNMLKTLEGMSGKRHVSRISSKSVTRDMQKLLLRNEGKASYTMSTVEEPVISYNDMAFIQPRNSILFRAGNSPIWNRNETVLPMSWRLLKDDIKQPGASFTLQTVPTLSSAKDFDVRKNQPNFDMMFEKRMNQAIRVLKAKEIYKDIYNLTDTDIALLDPQDYSDAIMTIVEGLIEDDRLKEQAEAEKYANIEDERNNDIYNRMKGDLSNAISAQAGVTDNKEVAEETQRALYEQKINDEKRYAGSTISKSDLYNKKGGRANHQLDELIARAYSECRPYFERQTDTFMVKNGNLYDYRGVTLFIESKITAREVDLLNEKAKDSKSRIYADEEIQMSGLSTYDIKDAFLEFLTSTSSWNFAEGKFEEEMAKLMKD